MAPSPALYWTTIFLLSLSSSTTSSTSSSSSSCSSSHVSSSLSQSSPCQPRPVVVAVPWPNTTEVHHMTPTHVQVYRCGGGCSSSPGLRRCVATLRRPRTVPVMLASCGVRAGLCDKQCATVSLLEDASCECSCPREVRQSCEASRQHQWREQSCQCDCLDYQGRRDCEEKGHHWLTANCTCHSSHSRHQLNIELSRTETNNTTPSPPPPVSITREIIVIVLLSTINSCLVVVLVLLLIRLRAVKVEERGEKDGAGGDEDDDDCYQVLRPEDSYLARPRLVSEATYSDLEIYSASSGFVSECSASQAEPAYETAEAVRSKKYQRKETYQEVPGTRGDSADITYDRAMQAIDETLQMLKDSADKL